jgi:hypothetical protein
MYLMLIIFFQGQGKPNHQIAMVYYLYRTQGAEGSQPAMKIRRSEDMNKAYKIHKRCKCAYECDV